MSNGALSLSDYPAPKVVLACRRCDRGGRFDKAALLERAGPDEALPTLRLKLAEGLGCELAKASLNGGYQPGFEQCGAHYRAAAAQVRLFQPPSCARCPLALCRGMDWQPIRTASSGERVLVCDRHGNVFVAHLVVLRWYDDAERLIDRPEWWMPLPVGPSQGAEQPKAPRAKRIRH